MRKTILLVEYGFESEDTWLADSSDMRRDSEQGRHRHGSAVQHLHRTEESELVGLELELCTHVAFLVRSGDVAVSPEADVVRSFRVGEDLSSRIQWVDDDLVFGGLREHDGSFQEVFFSLYALQNWRKLYTT